MLREVDELARELKRPIESTRRMIHVKLNSQIEKVFQTFQIDLFTPRIVREKQTERKSVSHLGVMHFHVWSDFTRRRVWIAGCETIDDVVRLRPVGQDALPIEKVAPFHDHFRDARVVRECPVMK